jgi:hypothetical protein
MFPILLPFFQWVDHSALSVEIRASTWQFAVLEMVHLLGLTMLLGTLMVVDLRLFGFGLRHQKVGDLARDVRIWMWSGLWTMVISGVLLFFGEPIKLFGNASFHVKMLLLLLAIVFQLTLFRTVTSDRHIPSLIDKVAAVLSLALWFSVGLAGRGIGFL